MAIQGVQWPAQEDGAVRTTVTAKECLAVATGAADTAAADAVLAEPDWR